MTASSGEAAPELAAIDVRSMSRRFGDQWALDDVSLQVGRGEIHALLGPNGAGKTTLLRTLTGLLAPTSGEIHIAGRPLSTTGYRAHRKLFGLVPSGDRSLYLRISGLENLVFFGRMYGLRRRKAVARAWECLEAVGLADAGRKQVGLYSHGMQKRLSVARAILIRPPVLLVDEATHDLDPEGARRVQDLVAADAAEGTAVLWATQRLDEIRRFADGVTVLDHGRVAFAGSVARLSALAESRRYVLHLEAAAPNGNNVGAHAGRALDSLGTVAAAADSDGSHYVVALHDTAVLGDAFAALSASGIRVLDCREERSSLEGAFLRIVGAGPS